LSLGKLPLGCFKTLTYEEAATVFD
jgi:hypothetical protein